MERQKIVRLLVKEILVGEAVVAYTPPPQPEAPDLMGACSRLADRWLPQRECSILTLQFALPPVIRDKNRMR
jgi:hypothetical protein